jgi:hypothetical protein
MSVTPAIFISISDILPSTVQPDKQQLNNKFFVIVGRAHLFLIFSNNNLRYMSMKTAIPD